MTIDQGEILEAKRLIRMISRLVQCPPNEHQPCGVGNHDEQRHGEHEIAVGMVKEDL